MTWQQRRAEEIANRIDRGVIELTRAAEDPAGVLNERGYDDTNAEEWGARQKAAADAARAYADQLRERVAAGWRPTDVHLREAEKVADAANCGGILIDGRPTAEATATADGADIWHTADREAWEAGTHPTQTKAEAVEGSGAFTHVAEDGQLPYWHLGGMERRAEDTAGYAPAAGTEADDAAEA